MIRINLIEAKKKKKPKPLPVPVVLAVLLTLFTVIGVVYIHYSLTDEIGALKSKKTENDNRLRVLNKKIKELKNYEKLVKSVEKKKKVIIGLRKNQALPVRVLDEISRLLPDTVWLTSLRYTGKRVSIDAMAFTNSDIVTYINNLKRSPLFVNVYLSESVEKFVKEAGMAKGIRVYKFKATIGIRG
ncbi:MAG TPA: hypothetical protein ENK09_04085 [Nitrospirae bacterium]|nr:hypothetical protein [Nitrospirota bacterium]